MAKKLSRLAPLPHIPFGLFGSSMPFCPLAIPVANLKNLRCNRTGKMSSHEPQEAQQAWVAVVQQAWVAVAQQAWVAAAGAVLTDIRYGGASNTTPSCSSAKMSGYPQRNLDLQVVLVPELGAVPALAVEEAGGHRAALSALVVPVSEWGSVPSSL